MRHSSGRTTLLPTADQFPSFTQTLFHLAKADCQCIWYLADKRRCCAVGISEEANEAALQSAKSIFSGIVPSEIPGTLAKVAEMACCVRHHRNKMWGSGLAEELAARWWRDMHKEMSQASSIFAKGGLDKQVSCSMRSHNDIGLTCKPSVGISRTKQSNIVSGSSAADAQRLCSQLRGKVDSFARHEVFKGETLLTKIVSIIGPQEPRDGSLYVYTHASKAFTGMIKIGYTSNTVESRLSYWHECGHGQPNLLATFPGVRNPQRIEILTHFELIDFWYALRWCKPHRKAHIEWFKVGLLRASEVGSTWSRWMSRANPYDRRGNLKATWKGHIEFLAQHDVPITAAVMLQVQEIEEGSTDLDAFIDDSQLRIKKEPTVKLEN